MWKYKSTHLLAEGPRQGKSQRKTSDICSFWRMKLNQLTATNNLRFNYAKQDTSYRINPRYFNEK